MQDACNKLARCGLFGAGILPEAARPRHRTTPARDRNPEHQGYDMSISRFVPAAASAPVPLGRPIRVDYEAGLAVTRAGPAGFAAALQAARMGVRTIVVEKYDMPGGVHTSGLQGHAAAGVGGIHSELMRRFAAEGHVYTATEETHPGWAGNPLSH